MIPVLQFAATPARHSVIKVHSSRAVATILEGKLPMAVVEMRFDKRTNDLD
jgi:hypothetical protein